MRIENLNKLITNNSNYSNYSTAVVSAKKFLEKSKFKLENIVYRQLKDDKVALLYKHPTKGLVDNTHRTTFFVFDKNNLLIEKSYSTLFDAGKKIFSTTTNFYKDGHPYTSSWLVRLFKNGKLLTSYTSKKH